jgi:hypothetical protein
MKKKKKEVNAISGTSKSSKSSKASSAAGGDQEENSRALPPFLRAEELIRMGQECGFDEEEGELLEAAGQMELDDKLLMHAFFSASQFKYSAFICIRISFFPTCIFFKSEFVACIRGSVSSSFAGCYHFVFGA